jgi:hypothetical protein
MLKLDWWLLAVTGGSVAVMVVLGLWALELVSGRLLILAMLGYFAAFLGFITS